MNSRLFVATQVHHSPRKVIAGDIETRGLGGEFLLGALLPEGGKVRFYETADDMLQAFLGHRFRGMELLLHNADYDLRYFLPYLVALSKKTYATSLTVDGANRIIYCTITKGNASWYIRDTYALMPYPLRALHSLAGMHKLNIGLGEGSTFNPALASHRDYLARDCEMLLAAYQHFCRGVRQAFDVAPGITAGSTAMRAFQQLMPLNNAYWRQRPAVEKLAREAYFGGLTFVRTLAPQPDCVKIDVHAMYAAAMLEGVPVGSATYTTRERLDRPGLWRCQVDCPRDLPFTFIPARLQSELYWATGRFHTVLYSHTIALAREVGYTITVQDGYYFDRVDTSIFAPFVRKCYEYEHSDQPGVQAVAKLMRNSLYGKFGQKGVGKQYTLTATPTEDMTPLCTRQGEIIEHVYYTTSTNQRSHMQPVWAGWITASARNMLARTVYQLGPSGCYYGDTDSIVLSRTMFNRAIIQGTIQLGRNYGNWTVQHTYRSYRPLGPKAYIGYTSDGLLDIRHKGIPAGTLSPQALEALQPGQSLRATYTKVNRALNTTGDRVSVELATKSLVLLGSGRWQIEPDTWNVIPAHLPLTPDI